MLRIGNAVLDRWAMTPALASPQDFHAVWYFRLETAWLSIINTQVSFVT
jgi:hypothetical protein